MNDVKGGYQIIDLSKDNIYDIAKGYNQKAILIKTNSTYVFGSLTKDLNNYILSYVDTDNNLHQITIEPDNTTTDNTIDLDSGGGEPYVLPIASASTLGGIKVGENLSIDENGVLSASGGGGSVDYDLDILHGVSLLSYNSSSKLYTLPSDGIVQLSASANNTHIKLGIRKSGSTEWVIDAHNITIESTSNRGNLYNSIYLRKGVQVYIDSLQTTGISAKFYPYVAV